MQYCTKQFLQLTRISNNFLILILSLIVLVKYVKLVLEGWNNRQNFTKTSQTITYKIKHYRCHTIISLKPVFLEIIANSICWLKCFNLINMINSLLFNSLVISLRILAACSCTLYIYYCPFPKIKLFKFCLKLLW